MQAFQWAPVVIVAVGIATIALGIATIAAIVVALRFLHGSRSLLADGGCDGVSQLLRDAADALEASER